MHSQFKLKLAFHICKFLPPLISQQVRSYIISVNEAENLSMDFKRTSFTGGVFRGNTKDFHAFRFYIHGFYDWRNVVLSKKILQFQRGDIIEVGANIGTETISLAFLDTEVKVHAFEPVPNNFKSLEAIKKENQLKNLKLYKLLLSDKAGSVGFQMPSERSSGSGHIIENYSEKSTCLDVETLDNLSAQFRSCSTILIDVEGFEYKVLKGATKILKKFRPFLIIEVNEKFLEKRTNISVPFLLDELESWGYEPFYINKIGLTKVEGNDFKRKHNKNWLCIPVEKRYYRKRLSRTIFLKALNPFV